MIPRVQSRIGKRGRCLNACIASILEIPEASVPDFPASDDYIADIDRFLAPFGVVYKQRPITEPPPKGHHMIEGISPRGGMHAVVGKDGKFVHDPHPGWYDPRRGLVKPLRWGVLEPLEDRVNDASGMSWTDAILQAKVLFGPDGIAEIPATHLGGQVRFGKQGMYKVGIRSSGGLGSSVKVYGKGSSFEAAFEDAARNGKGKRAKATDIGRSKSSINMFRKVRATRAALKNEQYLCKNCGAEMDRPYARQATKWTASDSRARLHRALDAVMNDAVSLHWRISAAPTGKYRSFQTRAWPSADYANGSPAITLYSDSKEEKENLESATIMICAADWSMGRLDKAKYGSFVWRTLTKRATGLKQAKEIAAQFLAAHPEYAPTK